VACRNPDIVNRRHMADNYWSDEEEISWIISTTLLESFTKIFDTDADDIQEIQ